MNEAPKSIRLHIGVCGRTNVGKSSFLNMIAGQDVAITSHIPGTTTDIVEKTMELLPIGPVVFLDTAGIDDTSQLSGARLKKTYTMFERADVLVLIVEPDIWTEYEGQIVTLAATKHIPLIIAVNKIDTAVSSASFTALIRTKTPHILFCSMQRPSEREHYIAAFKDALINVAPDTVLQPPPLIGDLIRPGGIAVLIVPIDLEAPKSRIILPQVQTIRDALDHNAAAVIVKEHEYRQILDMLKTPPDIVVCDSQVVHKMVADTPPNIPCTTFSILFGRLRGDLVAFAEGLYALAHLAPNDKILIAEACSHHPLEDDIGRIKIPRWIQEYTGFPIHFDVCSGKDFPDVENLTDYTLIIHCGGCMHNRRLMLSRIQHAREKGVAITNYGLAISFVQGVIERVLSPFPDALNAYRRIL